MERPLNSTPHQWHFSCILTSVSLPSVLEHNYTNNLFFLEQNQKTMTWHYYGSNMILESMITQPSCPRLHTTNHFSLSTSSTTVSFPVSFSDEKLELVLLALQDLKTCLQNQGSNLMIRFGAAESIVSQIVSEIVDSCDKFGLENVASINVFAEEEVEYNLRSMMESVKDCLLNLSLSQGSAQLVQWWTPFYDIKDLEKLPAFYPDFKKLKLSPTSPLASPVLPRLDIDLDWGNVPSFDQVQRYVLSVNPLKLNDKWTSVKRVSAKSVLSNGSLKKVKVPSDVGKGSQILVHEKLRSAESRNGASFGALFSSVLSLGIISRRKVYYEAIKYEKERNAGFLSPFGYSAATVAAAADTVCLMEWYWLLGLKSQTYSEGIHSVRIWRWNDYLIQYTVLGDEGPASLLVHGFGAFLEHYRDNVNPIADAGNRVWALTLLGFGKSEKPNIVYTELMWAELIRDFIVDVVGEPVHLVGNSIGGYFAAIVAGLWPTLAKSVILINAAGSVITGNPSSPVNEEMTMINALTWTVNIVGSMFPSLLQFDICRRFSCRSPGFLCRENGSLLVHEVQRLVYLKEDPWALEMRLYCDLVDSFPTELSEERRVSSAAWLGSRILLLYLRSNVGNIVKNCYPTVSLLLTLLPFIIFDAILYRVLIEIVSVCRTENELMIGLSVKCFGQYPYFLLPCQAGLDLCFTPRKSQDPGVLMVLESVFSFDLSIPVNYLFESFGGKVLIIQGMKDPLSNSESKLSELRECCIGIEIRELDAGHCPHDERPEEVNSFICEWIVNMERSLLPC
ncbi:hypothetical protein IFM89_034298 [Coptis chinensis]|uniref:AB hydrolase-1 domain-containing protein n=1 Tax=Coptis chinensis TaxID=261450 RepID=A0A835IIQ2_9MAGN|nr:hypothetical protein IFM89_034298 [Coptis chinensis]